MATTLRERLIEKLKSCPCCRWDRTEENTREDGIPSDCVHENVFRCGAAVFITEEDELKVGRACPGPLQDECDELYDRVVEDMPS